MESPEQHHALLNGSGDLESVSTASYTARHRGGLSLWELRIQGDGTCSMKQAEERVPRCPSILSLCCGSGGGPLPAQIPAADVIGATTSGNELAIWHAPLSSKPGAEKPTRRLCRTPPLMLESPQAADAAAQQLRRSCCWPGGQQPPRLLVVVNPASGPGKAPAIFERDVRPALEAAGCQLDVHLTQKRGHATEIVQRVAPGSIDCLVAIGGDGTVHEVLQGLLVRADWDATRGIPLAQVPCGSGNALAASTGLWNVGAAVHAIVKGQRVPLDIATVLQADLPTRWFSFLSLNYGLITNLDIGTEHLRWMGGTRFVVGALQQVLLNRPHRARVAVLEPGQAVAGGGGSSTGPVAASAAAAAEGAAAAPAAGVLASQGAGQQLEVLGWEMQRESLQAAAQQPGPPVRHLAAFQQLAGQQLPPGWQWLPDAEVALFTATNLPRLDMNFHLAPEAAASSGHFNLIYSPPPKSRLEALRLFMAAESGEAVQKGLVLQRRVAALSLEPLSTGTWIVVDGEVVPFKPAYLEVHPGLCCAIVAPPPLAP